MCECISPIFIRPKPDGFSNLYIYFQMETLQLALELITPGCFMAPLNLKNAYYSTPINPDHTKYLKFLWKEQFYKFLVLPNSYQIYQACETPSSYNLVHNILRIFDVLPNFALTTSETKGDY